MLCQMLYFCQSWWLINCKMVIFYNLSKLASLWRKIVSTNSFYNILALFFYLVKGLRSTVNSFILKWADISFIPLILRSVWGWGVQGHPTGSETQARHYHEVTAQTQDLTVSANIQCRQSWVSADLCWCYCCYYKCLFFFSPGLVQIREKYVFLILGWTVVLLFKCKTWP